MKKHILFTLFFACSAQAQYFNSHAFQLPSLGWMGFDTSAQFLRPNPDASKWPTTDHLQIGFGYQYALYGYDLWWFTQTAVSLGYARNYNLPATQILAGFNALTGLRYNFATLAWRPFVSGGLGVFTLFANPNSQNTQNNSTASSKSWMTFQFGPGLEWIFVDEMSFQLETGAMAFLDFQKEARFSYCLKLAYLFYF